jgi:transcription initiation factor TFIID subunit 11
VVAAPFAWRPSRLPQCRSIVKSTVFTTTRITVTPQTEHDTRIAVATMASPPHIPQLNVPGSRKRGSISSHSGAPTKKRKPSNLRNAFSPDAESVGGSPRQYSRSPSVESNITTSVVNGAGGKKRRKKGGDGGSVAGSSIRGGKGGDGRSAIGGEDEDGDGEVEDDDDDEMGEEMGMEIEGGMSVEARRKQEKEYERYVPPSTFCYPNPVH